MRRLLFVLGLACFVSMSSGNFASAAGGGKGKGDKGNSQSVRERLIKRFDKDGDGKLSDEERKAAREEMSKQRGNAKPGLKKLKGRPGKK